MKNTIIFLGCILITGFISCEKEKIELFTVEYIQSDGWIDYYYSVIIDQKGTMQVLYHDGLGDFHRESNYQIEDTDLVQLTNKLITLSSINLKDKYGFGEFAPTDGPVDRYRYKTNIQSDSTSLYFPEKGELPVELESFISTIDKIIEVTDTLLVN